MNYILIYLNTLTTSFRLRLQKVDFFRNQQAVVVVKVENGNEN